MSNRVEWPAATAGLFIDAAGIAAYIDDGRGLDPATAAAKYRRELAELQADVSPTARRVLATTLAAQRGAVTAWLDALVHLGAAGWRDEIDGFGHWTGRRHLVIIGPVEDAPRD
jgi:hypothetical protein